jgi:hypothetical protein
MSEPGEYQSALGGAIAEIMSGLSSLHMPPTRHQASESEPYLSDSEPMVAHAILHFRAAIRNLERVGKLIKNLEYANIFRKGSPDRAKYFWDKAMMELYPDDPLNLDEL